MELFQTITLESVIDNVTELGDVAIITKVTLVFFTVEIFFNSFYSTFRFTILLLKTRHEFFQILNRNVEGNHLNFLLKSFLDFCY